MFLCLLLLSHLLFLTTFINYQVYQNKHLKVIWHTCFYIRLKIINPCNFFDQNNCTSSFNQPVNESLLTKFCNFTQAAAQLLGFDDCIPPYANARGDQLLTGVNFASAAARIRDETGQQLGGRITFRGQVQNYQQAAEQVVNILGDEDSAANYLSKCIYSVGLGSNDYLNNYFMPTYYTTSQRYTPEQYADALIQEYSQQIRTLYNYGTRKGALIGVGQVGCSPNELAQLSSDGIMCIDRINDACMMFNQRPIRLVDEFNQLDGAHFTYINAYRVFEDIVRNAPANRLTVTRGCCGVGRNNGHITCLPYQAPCPNRNQYLFWDAFHPTEAANILIGKRSYRAQSSSDAYPVDVSHLAQI